MQLTTEFEPGSEPITVYEDGMYKLCYSNPVAIPVPKNPTFRVKELLRRLSEHLPNCETSVHAQMDYLPVIREVMSDFQICEERCHLVIRHDSDEYHFFALREKDFDKVACCVSAHWRQKTDTIFSVALGPYHLDDFNAKCVSFALEAKHIDALESYEDGEWSMPLKEKLYPVVFTGNLWLQLEIPADWFFGMCRTLRKWFGVLFVGMRDYRQWKTLKEENDDLKLSYFIRTDPETKVILTSREETSVGPCPIIVSVGSGDAKIDPEVLSVEPWSNQAVTNVFASPVPKDLGARSFRNPLLKDRILPLLKDMIITGQGVIVLDTERENDALTTWAVYDYRTPGVLAHGTGIDSFRQYAFRIRMSERPIIVKGYDCEKRVLENIGIDATTETVRGLWKGLIDVDLAIDHLWTHEKGIHDASHGVCQQVSIINSLLFGTKHLVCDWSRPSPANSIDKLPRPFLSVKEMIRYRPAAVTSLLSQLSINGIVIKELTGILPIKRLYHVVHGPPGSESAEPTVTHPDDDEDIPGEQFDLSFWSAPGLVGKHPPNVNDIFGSLLNPLLDLNNVPTSPPPSLPEIVSLIPPPIAQGPAVTQTTTPVPNYFGMLDVVQVKTERTVSETVTSTTVREVKRGSRDDAWMIPKDLKVKDYRTNRISEEDEFVQAIFQFIKKVPGATNPDIIKHLRGMKFQLENYQANVVLEHFRKSNVLYYEQVDKYKRWYLV